MIFKELNLKGAYLIEPERHLDERGSFARAFCKKELKKVGINFEICQCNISENTKAGTLRGMHYQKAPFLEQKIVSCIKGQFQDVIVDLRKESATYLKHQSVILSEEKIQFLYIPENFAHGFQTLVDNTTVFYQLSAFFEPNYYDGLRYDDPMLDIDWISFENRIISERDKNYVFL